MKLPSIKIGEGCKIGNNVEIGNYPFSFHQDDSGHLTEIEPKYNIIIGDEVFLNPFTSVAFGTVNETVIGDNTKLDCHCLVAHDVKIGRSCIISPNVKLLGHVKIGDYSRINTNAVIHQKVKIGKNCIVGANSYVRHDVPDNTVVYGSPAKIVHDIKYPRRFFL
ncbi:acyltransferase [Nitrososphaeria virus YSH_1032793]|uniref:Acyltransferase n=1 Tax=Nitrososphaeria virus YSH_1032793 TaxID=3071320 RepID=A0A976UAC4_9CAUD|nr:acyltransferase [Yangshan Harbor Nitrososphaeria virus]UVF62249.1 acyltransferase [Nitrososphaeria virus YSH_1032793]